MSELIKLNPYLFIFLTGLFINSCSPKKDNMGLKKQSTYPCFFELTPRSVKYGDSVTLSKASNIKWSSIKSISVLGKNITEQNPSLLISAKSTTTLRGTATYNDGSMKYCEQSISVTGLNSNVSCSLTASPAAISGEAQNVTATLTVMGEDTSKIMNTSIQNKSLNSNSGGSVELVMDNAQLILGTVELENDEKVYCEFQVRNHSENICKSEASELETKELADKNRKLDEEFEETLRTSAAGIIGSAAQKITNVSQHEFDQLPNSICEAFSNSDCSVHKMKRAEDNQSAEIKEIGVFQMNGKYYEYYLLDSWVSFSLYKSNESHAPITYKVDTNWEYQELEVCECKGEEFGLTKPADADVAPPPEGRIYYFETSNKDKAIDLEAFSVPTFNKKRYSFQKKTIPPGPGEKQPTCPRNWDVQT